MFEIVTRLIFDIFDNEIICCSRQSKKKNSFYSNIKAPKIRRAKFRSFVFSFLISNLRLSGSNSARTKANSKSSKRRRYDVAFRIHYGARRLRLFSESRKHKAAVDHEVKYSCCARVTFDVRLRIRSRRESRRGRDERTFCGRKCPGRRAEE